MLLDFSPHSNAQMIAVGEFNALRRKNSADLVLGFNGHYRSTLIATLTAFYRWN
ncbi:hypothetical protein [Mesorhizobium sp.]|uniref:hypothetical protein n=1 Tax=Mesorhizobium sp. TaxID=1871066 RepID=UPI00342DEA18